jgi:hypothetical protein
LKKSLTDEEVIRQSIQRLGERLDSIAKREADLAMAGVKGRDFSAQKQEIIEKMEGLLAKWEALQT